MSVKRGEVYKSFRKELVTPKEKYHLYLADDIVFLINSEHNFYDFDIALRTSDCSILTKDCYLQTKTIYKFDKKSKVIKADDMSDRALNALLTYLKDKSLKKAITKIYVERAIGILTLCLEERKKNNKVI